MICIALSRLTIMMCVKAAIAETTEAATPSAEASQQRRLVGESDRAHSEGWRYHRPLRLARCYVSCERCVNPNKSGTLCITSALIHSYWGTYGRTTHPHAHFSIQCIQYDSKGWSTAGSRTRVGNVGCTCSIESTLWCVMRLCV